MQWCEVDEFLLDAACDDIAGDDCVRPCLVAFSGEDPLVVAFVRPFVKGAYQEPLTEVLALVAGLQADRLALSLSGRAWSLDDPVPPVVEGVGDLRQRVVCLLRATSTGCSQTVHPFTRCGRDVSWGEPLLHDSGSGWIADALRVTVARRAELAAPDDDVTAQALRCIGLGHRLGLAPAVAERLGLAGAR